MPMKINALSVDLLSNNATIALNDGGSHVHINVKIETPGNQPENRLQEIAKEAAKAALRDALSAL